MISLFSRLRPNQFTTIHSYPFIPNIHIIGVILPARKDSKIAIMWSCHLVSVKSANIHTYFHISIIRWLDLTARTDSKIALTRSCRLVFVRISWYGTYSISITAVWRIYAVTDVNLHIRSWYQIHTGYAVQSVTEKVYSYISILSDYYTTGSCHYFHYIHMPWIFQTLLFNFSIILCSLVQIRDSSIRQIAEKIYSSPIITIYQAHPMPVHYDSGLIISWKKSQKDAFEQPMLVYFRHKRCVCSDMSVMDKVNFNCVVEVFYPAMNELEHQFAADLLHEDQYLSTNTSTAMNTQIHLYIYTIPTVTFIKQFGKWHFLN